MDTNLLDSCREARGELERQLPCETNHMELKTVSRTILGTEETPVSWYFQDIFKFFVISLGFLVHFLIFSQDLLDFSRFFIISFYSFHFHAILVVYRKSVGNHMTNISLI